jgi:endoglucanase
MPEPGRYVGTAIYTSNFQTTNDGWNLNSQQGASAQLTRTDNTLSANITNGGTQGWHVQLIKGNLSLQQGKKYRVSFKAKAETARSVTVYIGMSKDPWSAYSGYNGVSLTDTFSVYTLVFDMGATDNAARMVFDLGNSTVNVSVTDVIIEEIVFEPPTSVSLPQAGIIDIYPNPVKGRLFLRNAVDVEKVSVYNLQGKAILEKSVQDADASIDVSGLKPGIYIIRTEGKGIPVTRKFIKQ